MKRYSGFYLFIFGLLFIPGLLAGCKSEPLPNAEPPLAPLPPSSFALAFRGVEADDPAHMKVLFDLEAEPPLPSGGNVEIASWQIEINGQDAKSAFSLEYPQTDSLSMRTSITSRIPLKLNMDIGELAAKGLAPKDDYNVIFIAELDYSLPSTPPERVEVRGLAAFPGVQPPRFTITEIAILKAELVNTRFRVGLKIDNPNPFPIELSAFSYNLYGNGLLWADGADKNIINIREKSSLNGNVMLLMNFINMNRTLLDQIINLEDVNYRFTGDVQISTGIEYLPKFNDGFDVSGYSKVLER
ncbi:MAG: LEA type 2 family protein [Treponema sp.]|jgi:LEA14-like dessication related protein|nr:LEA type 2 family protein [Treponema sp.]